MKILFFQPIFIPDDNLLKKNLDSIESLKFILQDKPDEYEITFKISGWVKKEEYWDNLVKTVEKQDFNISYERLEHNYGKAYVINKIVEETEEHDYIFTCDSDIIFLENQHYLERFVECMERFPQEKRGLVAPKFNGTRVHKLNLFDEKIAYRGKYGQEILKYNSSMEQGIAGGCIFIYHKAWKKIGGYRVTGIFGGDDGLLMKDIHREKFLKFVLISLTIKS